MAVLRHVEATLGRPQLLRAIGALAVLTDQGAAALAAAAPGHIKAIREHLLNRLTEEQLHQLAPRSATPS